MGQIFLSNWFKGCLLFCTIGGWKSISICHWRPYSASFPVNLDSFAPGISWQPPPIWGVLHRIYKTLITPRQLVLQDVDDILLCAETEEACSQASEDLLNCLVGCGYKASREKAQLCQQFVKYLGLIISEGATAISPEIIKPILNYPLPMT